MSLSKISRGGEKMAMKPWLQNDTEKLSEGEELLLKKEEFLKKKVDQELLFARKNCRTKKKVALQALRRKKFHEKHLKYINCAVNAVRSALEHIDIVNKINDLIKDSTEEQDVAPDMSDILFTSVGFGVEFDEDELLAELKRLEKDLDEIIFEEKSEEEVPCFPVSSSPSLSCSAKTEEEEVEDELEYLRRWANETL